MVILPDETVRFERWDMPFVQQLGIQRATETVLNYVTLNPLPFLYDTYQLAAFLNLRRRDLFAYTKHPEREYQEMAIPKRDGSLRHLCAPSPALRMIQKTILRCIVQHEPVSPYATAYIRGRSLSANAKPHVGKPYLLKLDISDFFGSITFEQVYAAAFNSRYFPRQIGVMLTELCCCKGRLPQGAPTSPALSNQVMEQFDTYIGAWCRTRGIAYTRYCDDITFSADFPLLFVYAKAKTMLEDMGFTVNEKKTHLISAASRQTVTGLTVNKKLSVPRDYKRRLRQEVYYALRFGAADSAAHIGGTFAAKPVRYWQQLLGQVQYVLHIEPDNVWFQQAQKRLLQTAPDGLSACGA